MSKSVWARVYAPAQEWPTRNGYSLFRDEIRASKISQYASQQLLPKTPQNPATIYVYTRFISFTISHLTVKTVKL